MRCFQITSPPSPFPTFQTLQTRVHTDPKGLKTPLCPLMGCPSYKGPPSTQCNLTIETNQLPQICEISPLERLNQGLRILSLTHNTLLFASWGGAGSSEAHRSDGKGECIS
jgi:hypothetical protein